MSELPKSFEVGDTIQKNCTPIFKVSKIWSDRSGKICDVCFKACPENEDPQLFVKKCPGCNLMSYCSKECRAKDWKNGHKLECTSKAWKKTFEPLQNLSGQPTREMKSDVNMRAQLFRSMAFLHMNPKMLDRQFDMHDGSTRSFNDWLNQHKLKLSTRRTEALCSKLAEDVLDEKLDTGVIPADRTFFMKMAQIILLSKYSSPSRSLDTSCHEIEIFLQLANLQHSCKPTAVLSRNIDGGNENVMDIRAIATIPEGESPTISYRPHTCMWKFGKSACKIMNIDPNCERCLANSITSVNFDKLNSHIDFQKNYEAGLDNVWPWEDILKKHEKVIGEMNKMYHEYDEPLALQFLYTALAIIYNFVGRDKWYQLLQIPETSELLVEASVRLSVTYGKAHPQYRQLSEVFLPLFAESFLKQLPNMGDIGFTLEELQTHFNM